MPERAGWVDFRRVRESVDFAAVLRHYGVEVRVRGGAAEGQAHGFCPLPTHEGNRRSPSFSANLKKRIWQCFGCGARGNVLDFAARMEGLDPENKEHIRRAALLLQDLFLGGEPEAESKPANGRVAKGVHPAGSRRLRKDTDPPESPMPPPEDNRPRIVNAPLTFELKSLDPDHPYLHERKLLPETIAHFGLGFCKQGMMKGRIAIPLHDERGELVGYAGRIVDDKKVGPDCPKYLFPGPRERDGTVHEFRKSAVLYNAHRLLGPVEELVIVEGFFAACWLHQNGWSNVVAVMGSSCSEQQAEQVGRLTHFDARISLMTDGDDAGRRCAESLFAAVAPRRFVHWAQLDPGEQPDDCDPDRLHELLALPVR